MIGFDFGTTRCKVAHIDPAGKPNSVVNARGDHSTPTVVYFDDSGSVLVGTDAVEQGFIDPKNCVRNFKLLLGTTENLLSDGKMVTPTDAAAIVIGKMKEDVERQVGIQVEEAVATCPANFRDDAKQALLEAYERNGIRVQKLMPEPTAAGVAYALGKQGRRDLISLIYDWGGGTLDVTVQKLDGDQITILATEGIRRCGGNDLSACLERQVLDEIEAKFGERPAREAEPLLFYDLAQRVEAAKISLGHRTEVPLVVAFRGSQVVKKLTQDQFHKDIDPIVEQSLEAVDKAVAAAGLKMDQIDHLIMVGGTSRLPYVQDRLAEHTGKYPKTDVDPEKAIAYGAALVSVGELAKEGRTATIRGQVIPAPELFVWDVTAHAVGCCVVNVAGSKERMINSVLIPKNTSIPCRKSDRFFLQYPEQTVARIEVLQGEPDAERDDCLLIGELTLTDLPPEANRTQRIQLEYVIDANGMVTVTGTDAVSGKQETVSVDYKKGIVPKRKPTGV